VLLLLEPIHADRESKQEPIQLYSPKLEIIRDALEFKLELVQDWSLHFGWLQLEPLLLFPQLPLPLLFLQQELILDVHPFEWEFI